MRTSILIYLLLVIIMATVIIETGAWWSRRSSRSSRGSISSRTPSSSRSSSASSRSWFRKAKSKVGTAIKDTAKKVSDKAKTALTAIKDTVKKVVDKAKDAVKFAVGAVKGANEMYKAYKEMKKANWKNSDKYFHAKGNYNAAKHGPGGKWAAKVISDIREGYQSKLSGQGEEDTAADQEANEYGRNGGDPNKYRPDGLPKQYRK